MGFSEDDDCLVFPDYDKEEKELRTEINNMITMIQLAVTSKPCNFEMYKDKVTEYREKLLKQAMKIKEMIEK